MATENNYVREQYNVMSQFANLAELESSDDDEGTNVIKKYSIEENKVSDKGKEIPVIHPTIPQNNNSQFDLSQFQDLSLLESSDEDIPDNVQIASNEKHNVSKPKHSKAALKRIEANENKQQQHAKTIAASVVKGVIGVTAKINKKKHNNTNKAYEALISMGFDDKISKEAVKKYNGDINKSIEYINAKQGDQKSEEVKSEDATCPFHDILMFAMHLHLVGCVLPKWMINILTLFNDSNLKTCHEAASLGKHQRKLFLDTVCKMQEPDNFIFVDTSKSIEIGGKYSNHCIVNVCSENAKYAELKSINGHKLNKKITNNHLSIQKGVYLFFNQQYKLKYLDKFLYRNNQASIEYFCNEYKVQQKQHIKKILKLDYNVDSKYGDWFLNVWNKYLQKYDINDCYESLASNIKFWKEVILNQGAMEIQRYVDHTFVVKTTHSRFVSLKIE